jgi:hypothetical protein
MRRRLLREHLVGVDRADRDSGHQVPNRSRASGLKTTQHDQAEHAWLQRRTNQRGDEATMPNADLVSPSRSVREPTRLTAAKPIRPTVAMLGRRYRDGCGLARSAR